MAIDFPSGDNSTEAMRTIFPVWSSVMGWPESAAARTERRVRVPMIGLSIAVAALFRLNVPCDRAIHANRGGVAHDANEAGNC